MCFNRITKLVHDAPHTYYFLSLLLHTSNSYILTKQLRFWAVLKVYLVLAGTRVLVLLPLGDQVVSDLTTNNLSTVLISPWA